MSVGVRKAQQTLDVGLDDPHVPDDTDDSLDHEQRISDAVAHAIKESEKIRAEWHPTLDGVPKLMGLKPSDIHMVTVPSSVSGYGGNTVTNYGDTQAFRSDARGRAENTSSKRGKMLSQMATNYESQTNSPKKKNDATIGDHLDHALASGAHAYHTFKRFPTTDSTMMVPLAHVAAAMIHRGNSPDEVHVALEETMKRWHDNVNRITGYNPSEDLEKLRDEIGYDHVPVSTASHSGPKVEGSHTIEIQHPDWYTHDNHRAKVGRELYRHPKGYTMPIMGGLGFATLMHGTITGRTGADSMFSNDRTEYSEGMVRGADAARKRRQAARQLGGMANARLKHLMGIGRDEEGKAKTEALSAPYLDFYRNWIGGSRQGASNKAGIQGRARRHQNTLSANIRGGPKPDVSWNQAGWGSIRPLEGATLHTPEFPIQPRNINEMRNTMANELDYNNWRAEEDGIYAPGQTRFSEQGEWLNDRQSIWDAFEGNSKIPSRQIREPIETGEPMDIAYRLLKNFLGLGEDDVTTQPDQPVQAPAEVAEEPPRKALGILGHHDWHDLERFDDKMGEWIDIHGMPTHIVSDGTSGTGAMAQQWADDNEITFIQHRPNFRASNRWTAPAHSRQNIVNSSDHILAFPSMHGSGTMEGIGMATKAGKPVHLHYIEHPHDTPIEQVKPNERQGSTYHDAWLTEQEPEREPSSEPTNPRRSGARRTGPVRGSRGRSDDNVEMGEPMDLAYRLLKTTSDIEYDWDDFDDPNDYYSHVMQRDTSERSGREDDGCCREAKNRFREISEGEYARNFLGGSHSPNEQYMECSEFENYIENEIQSLKESEIAGIDFIQQTIYDLEELLDRWRQCDEITQPVSEDPTFTAGEPMDLAWRLLT